MLSWGALGHAAGLVCDLGMLSLVLDIVLLPTGLALHLVSVSPESQLKLTQLITPVFRKIWFSYGEGVVCC